MTLYFKFPSANVPSVNVRKLAQLYFLPSCSNSVLFSVLQGFLERFAVKLEIAGLFTEIAAPL